MGELERRHRARNIRVSRGQLAAVLAGVLLLTTSSLAFGWLAGNRTEPPKAVARFDEQEAGQGMVDLLARVEANANPGAAVNELTFPDALASGEVAEIRMVPEPTERNVVIGQAGEAIHPDVDVRPPGRYTVRLIESISSEQSREVSEKLGGLTASVWIGARIEEGEVVHSVSQGGFPTEEDAQAAMSEFELAALQVGVEIAPLVVENPPAE